MCARDRIGDQEVTAVTPQNSKTTSGYMGRGFRYLKQKHNIKPQEKTPENELSYKLDWMALSTTYSKKALEVGKNFYGKFQKSRYFRYMPKSKTISHLIVLTALFVIVSTFVDKKKIGPQMERSKIWMFLYIGSFSMHFGAQVWMTLVSGLVLYFNLPRHIFGQVQQNLFPAYYVHCAVLSFVMVISFIKTQSEINFVSKDFCQVLAISVMFFSELAIRLYVSSAVVMLKHMKTKMEVASGSGQEVGQHVLGDLAQCPHYMKVLKKFRRLHSYTAIGTVLTVICSFYHLNYLTEKICL